MAEVERYNLKNPGVKRILQEVKELQSNPSDDYMSLPLEDNIFEWQFAIRGPKDSEFEGGFYHGRIQLPAEYPFKPPAFMLLTPNGRFETNTKICLSISAHHPEHWQPSWSVRTALVALIAFMPTRPEGALGSLDYTKEERRALAIKSREAAPKFGNAERQKLIDEIHAQMLKKAHPVPELPPSQVSSAIEADNSSVGNDQQSVEEELHASANAAGSDSSSNGASSQPPNVDATDAAASAPAAPAAASAPAAPAAASAPAAAISRPQPAVATRQQSSSDYGLTLLAMGLAVAIVALLVKKVLRFYGYIDV